MTHFIYILNFINYATYDRDIIFARIPSIQFLYYRKNQLTARRDEEESRGIESIFLLARRATRRDMKHTLCFMYEYIRITVFTVLLVTLRNMPVIHACLPRRKTESTA